MKRFKSKLGFLLGFVFGALIFSSMSISANSSEVTAVFAKFNFVINGEQREIDSDILVQNGRSYLPIRAISEELGYNVDYDGDTRTIYLSNNGENYLKKDDSKVGRFNNSTEGRVIQDLGTKYLKTVTVCDRYPEMGTMDDCLESHEEYGDFDFERLEKAIENGEISVHDVDENGNSLIHFAAEKDDYYVVQFLINNGADVNAQNNSGHTALHIYAINDRITSTVRLLLDSGASTKIEDSEGKIPLDYAKKYSGIWSSLRTHQE